MRQLEKMPAATVNEGSAGAPDVAVVIVSHNDGRWLDQCLSSLFAHTGRTTAEVIVVDNASTDETREVVESHPAPVRLVKSSNGGFSHGNNRGLELTRARYVLFLNPDTEVVEGTLEELISRLDASPDVGLVGVRQFTPDGTLWPTIRRFPSVRRAMGEALSSERWPVHPAWAGERVLNPLAYEQELECDWTSGSFMLVRREALASSGGFDERFFLYCEEPDLCLRIRRAGWSVRHIPDMAIIHHAGKAGVRPRMVAQDAYARRQYARKHFSAAHGAVYLAATGLRHVLRAAAAQGAQPERVVRRQSALWALRVLTGRGDPPFVEPPRTAMQRQPQSSGSLPADGPGVRKSAAQRTV